MMLLQGIDNAVVNVLLGDKFGNGAVVPHPVQQIQVIIVAVGLIFRGIDVLTQGGVEISALQIVGGQGVAASTA